jgi:hypothetical protein
LNVIIIPRKSSLRLSLKAEYSFQLIIEPAT